MSQSFASRSALFLARCSECSSLAGFFLVVIRVSSELKPCPFCGNRGEHEKDCYINLYFESEVLGADIPFEVIAKAFNQRAERTCKYKHIEGTWYSCDICGHWHDGILPPRYCPECGAKVVE